MPFTLTIRHGGKVTRERYEELAQALRALQQRGRELERDAGARRQAFELVGELCSLGDQMRASLLRRSLRDQLGPL